MIARCNDDGELFVPRSLNPRCPKCHKTNVRTFHLAELREILTAYFSKSSGASREPGPIPPPANESDEDGEPPQGRRSARPLVGDVAAEAVPPVHPGPARADPEDANGRATPTPAGGEGVTQPPVRPAARPSFSGEEPAVDVRPIHRAFVKGAWYRRPRNDQLILIRDELRGRGIHTIADDVEKIDEMREAWIAELEKEGRT
jgi:hypothetical protein